MARPLTIPTQSIVDTARQLFLAHGRQLSTAKIASAAGVSEGLIFKRFGTKEALFAAAMGLPSTAFADVWVERAGNGTVYDQLVTISERLIVHFREALPRMIMLRRATPVDPLAAMSQAESPPPVAILNGVTAYLQREMALGRFRAQEARVLARMLVGALANYVFFEVLGFETHTEAETAQTIQGMVTVIASQGSP